MVSDHNLEGDWKKYWKARAILQTINDFVGVRTYDLRPLTPEVNALPTWHLIQKTIEIKKKMLLVSFLILILLHTGDST